MENKFTKTNVAYLQPHQVVTQIKSDIKVLREYFQDMKNTTRLISKEFIFFDLLVESMSIGASGETTVENLKEVIILVRLSLLC
jgi:hypothetical protein